MKGLLTTDEWFQVHYRPYCSPLPDIRPDTRESRDTTIWYEKIEPQKSCLGSFRRCFYTSPPRTPPPPHRMLLKIFAVYLQQSEGHYLLADGYGKHFRASNRPNGCLFPGYTSMDINTCSLFRLQHHMYHCLFCRWGEKRPRRRACPRGCCSKSGTRKTWWKSRTGRWTR